MTLLAALIGSALAILFVDATAKTFRMCNSNEEVQR